MTFIASIIVLNVSIILMMIIAFSNITFGYQKQSLKLYKLVDFNNPDYEKYSTQQIEEHEKKLNIREYFGSVHNLNFIKFKLSGEKTWEERSENIQNACQSHKTVEYAVQGYYITTFGEKINNLIKCTKDTPNNILDIVKDALNAKEPEKQAPSGCCPFIKFKNVKNLLKTKEEKELEKKIKVIDNALLDGSDTRRINKFYECIHTFKNSVYNMQIEEAEYPTKAIPQITIDKENKLSKSEKKKILQLKDVNFLKDKKLSDYENLSAYWLQGYTGYNSFRVNNDGARSACLGLVNTKNPENKKIFQMTKLSYNYIYPSQSEDLSSYKSKRQIIIKNLNYRHHRDDKRKEMYTTLETENNKVDENYYDLMRNCRALSGEKYYEVYVKRLINTGCRPLGEPEWKIELKDTEEDNKVAKFQALHTK